MKLMRLMSFCRALFLCALLATTVGGQSLPDHFSKDDRGAVRVMDIRMYPTHYAPQWASAAYSVGPEFFNLSNVSLGSWNFTSQLKTQDDGLLNLQNKVVANRKNQSIAWHIQASARAPIPTRMLVMSVDLPVSTFAGMQVKVQHRTVTLPAEMQENPVVLSGAYGVRLIQIPTPKGPILLKGQWDVQIIDRRKWRTNAYTMRLYFTQHRGELTTSDFDMQVSLGGYQSWPLDLRDQSNMGFKDEVADDGQGGWTDQGRGNDLAELKVGIHDFGGIKMKVIDPATNDNRSCMVFGFAKRPFDLKQARIAIPPQASANARTLFVLHTAAWAKSVSLTKPIGVIRAHDAQGQTHDIPVAVGRELGDWWHPTDKPNGRVVWSAPNGESIVGVYLSRFELPAGRTWVDLEILPQDRCVWGVVAMTLCAEDAPLPSVGQTPLTITAGDNFKPLRWTQQVEPGSVLDLSTQYSSQPAGQSGRVVVRGRHFEFENKPGVPVRFHGVNLCYDVCFMPHEQSDRLAEQLYRQGFNLARLHHFDHLVLDPGGPDSHTLDADKVDRLFYLIGQFKKRGIYVTWDLYSYRSFRAEDSQLGRPYFREIKPLILVDERARKALTDFAQVLMTTPNPYTGMTLAQDPVLATTSTMNEDFLTASWNKYADVAPLFHKAYAQWLETNDSQADPENVGSPLFTRFIYESATAAHQSLQASLKQIGIHTPFTADNADRLLAANGLYDAFGYVDNHFYHDHPSFVNRSWSLPYSYSGASPVKQLTSSLRLQFPVRRLDKPYAITEYNFVMPNPYRAEGGALVGAYASFQDWDMLCRFDWASKAPLITEPGHMTGFSIANDPISLMAERMVNLLFRRGDVATARQSVAYVVDEQEVFTAGKDRSTHPDQYSLLGLLTGVGTVTRKHLSQQLPGNSTALVGDEKLINKLGVDLPFISESQDIFGALEQQQRLSPHQADAQQSRFTSDTGEIEIHASAGTFTVTTPRSEAVVLAGKGSQSAGLLHVRDATGPATIFAAAVDDKPLASSGRILLMHLTNVLNSQMTFRDQQGRVLEAWGKLPLLVKKGTATLCLSVEHPANIQVYAVDLSGKRLVPIQTTLNNRQQLTFNVDTFGCKDDGILVYELVRK